jgi:histidinol-phosphate/aromatic aminotransferase/cobyric acid decarboxylase-like protein
MKNLSDTIATTKKMCYHGGAFFSAIGNDFFDLERSNTVISADVLDAWFDPSPKVIAAIREYLPWVLKTSPPNHSEGLIKTISNIKNIPAENILLNAGSSKLMFSVLPKIITKNSNVLLLNPTYGEYRFILENLIHCNIVWLSEHKSSKYDFDVHKLLKTIIDRKIDVVILVNPNNPTGQFFTRDELKYLCKRIPETTVLWVDEAYIDYVGLRNSIEDIAYSRNNVIVCKSMSKVYALSGARCAYLVANEKLIDEVQKTTPPWAVSLPAQIAAVNALKDYDYYLKCYEITKTLKQDFFSELEKIAPAKIVPGNINSILCEFDESFALNGFLEKCRNQDLFLREVANMGSDWGVNAVRISVKDDATNKRMLSIIDHSLKSK